MFGQWKRSEKDVVTFTQTMITTASPPLRRADLPPTDCSCTTGGTVSCQATFRFQHRNYCIKSHIKMNQTFKLQFLYLLCASEWMMQVTQVTAEQHFCGRRVHAQHLSSLQTPFSGVCLTPEDRFAPLAQTALHVCWDRSVMLVYVGRQNKTQESNEEVKRQTSAERWNLTG